ncbi:MAG TPA: DUF4139 domain-containing protein [Azospirillum sp.]|nr:DUF4139 domain-containing protein [Azospirillum sp.]
MRAAVPSALVILLLAPAAHADQPLTLKRVLLSTGGVGYFEHEATVTGDGALTLEVRRDQVDDVLKSIVVYDDKGGVGTISLPGEEPLREAFRELPFGEEALASPAALLTALRGAEVRAVGARQVAGRILSVTEETVALPNGGGTVLRHRLSVVTPAGLQQVVLEETDSLTLADSKLQAQVDAALAALAQHGERGRRRLTIRTAGSRGEQGARTVRVAYVVEAPLWKATYRLTLPGGGATAGDLQGWAVLENLSGEDWADVDLTVVSGNPVTFRQALYSPYFVDRKEVPVEVLGRVLPKADEGSIEAPRAAGRTMMEAAPPAPSAAPAPMAAPMPAPMAKAMSAPPQRAADLTAAESSEATTQVVFRYPQPVTLANGGSLLLPIVARAVPAAAVDLYQPATQPRHPLAAVRLANDGAAGLPPGVLTLYERGDEGAVSYVGDARLAALPVGEERLLSFAVDQKVKVDRTEQATQALTRASAAEGVLQLTVTERQTTTYTISGAAREARTVIIEHPRRPGWDLVEPAGAKAELTPSAHRLPVTVPAGGTATLTVALERPRVDRLVLADMQPDQFAYYANARELPPAAREAMGKLAVLRTALADKQRRITDLEREQGELVKDQERLRQNLGALPTNSDLAKRTLARMGEDETRLEQIARDLATARKDAAAARQALVDAAKAVRL